MSRLNKLSSRMPAKLSRTWQRYWPALVLAAVAIAARALLSPVMGPPSASIFLVAIIVSAWIGGVGPSLLTSVALHIAHAYMFVEPHRLFEPTIGGVVSILGYYLVGIIVGFLSEKRAAATDRASAEHAEATAQREQLRATLACIADGVIVADVNGHLELMNRAAEAATGWSVSEAKGRLWSEVLMIAREDGTPEVENPIDRALHNSCVVHDTAPLMLVSRTGQSIPVSYSAAPISFADDHVSGVVLIFRDESLRRRTETEMKVADRRKDEFLATLAHELRNPLAPIVSGVELLKGSERDPHRVEQIRLIMQRQTQHMVHLIDDLLDVSRITRGILELRQEVVDLAEIIQGAVEATRPLFDNAGHELLVELSARPLLLHADAARLTEVFSNLLNNAAKFTPPNGRVLLSAKVTNGEAIIAISDSGIGIPPDKLEHVFELFTQLRGRSGLGEGGLGIGLALAKRLVEMHGGTIDVESPGENLGTTFRLRLPALPEGSVETQPPNTESASAQSSRPKRVLVVDDNADALTTLSRIVTLMGNDVREAADGQQALEVGAAFKPEVVLMDLGMPNIDGFEAARRMRRQDWGRGLTLIATTGWGQDGDRMRSAEAGFDYHLVKPVSVASLGEILNPVTSQLD